MNRTIFTFILAIFFTSYAKGQADLNFEKSVFEEVFPALLDSLHFDRRLAPPPPPPPEWKDSIQGSWQESEIMADYERRRAEIENDTTLRVVAIAANSYDIEDFGEKELINFYEEKNLQLEKSPNGEPLGIKISDLRHNEKIELIYRSDLPKKNVWKENYDFYLSGIIGFSRIIFDKTKNYGILRSGFSCGLLCGFSGYVFIKKVDGKWQIDKIKITEVS